MSSLFESAMSPDSGLFALAIIVLAVLAGLAGAVLTWLIYASARNRLVGAAALLVGFLIETSFIEQPALEVGLQLYPNDIVVVFMIAALVVAFSLRPVPITRPAFLIWIALGMVLLVSLAVGLNQFGKTAGVEVRPTFYYWIAGLYFCVQDFEDNEIRRMARWCLWGGYFLVALAAFRWTGVLGIKFDPSNDFRSIGSYPTFFLAAVGLVQLMLWLRGTGSKLNGFHVLFFAAFVLVLQHRSVWVAYLICATWLLFQERANLARRAAALIALASIAGIALAFGVALGMFDEVSEALVKSAVSVGDRRSTATDRFFGWEALLENWMAAGPKTILLGFPFGTGFRRVIDGFSRDYSPHNFYVFMLLRSGVIGTSLFVIATLMACLHSMSAKPTSDFDYELLRGLGLILLASIIYYVPYQGIHLHGAVTGLALAQMVKRSRVQKSGPIQEYRPVRPVLGRTRR